MKKTSPPIADASPGQDSRLSAAVPCWATAQDFVVREIRAEMGRRRMTAKAMCRIAGISTSHWSEMQNLKKPISMDRLIAAAAAVGLRLRLEVSVSPNDGTEAQPPSNPKR